jgi:hypothetical protein
MKTFALQHSAGFESDSDSEWLSTAHCTLITAWLAGKNMSREKMLNYPLFCGRKICCTVISLIL